MKHNIRIRYLAIVAVVLLAVCLSPVSALTEWNLEKFGTPDPVSPGDTITYTIAWTKSEEHDMYTGTKLADTLDSNVEFVSATGSYTLSGGVVTWTPAEQFIDSTTDYGDTLVTKGHFTLVVRVKAGTAPGTVIHNTAIVGGYDGADMWDQATAQEDTTVVSAGPDTEWRLEKTGTPKVVAPGGKITYRLDWTKIERNDMYIRTNLKDTFSKDVTFVSATGTYTVDDGGIGWEPVEQFIDSYTEVGITRTTKGHFTLVVRVNPDAIPSTKVLNTAVVGGFDGDGMWDEADDDSTTLVMNPVTLPRQSDPPTDPDDDGIFEDLNGNRRLDFNDVVLFFTYRDWIAAHEPVPMFDLNGNGRIDFADVVALFNEI